MITSHTSIIISHDQILDHPHPPYYPLLALQYHLQKQFHRLRYPHLHSGILNLISKGTNQNTFYHNYQQTFTQIPQVAVALCSFSTPLHTNNNDNTFYVLPIPSISKLQVRSRSIKYGWSVMRITFIATTNQELFLDIVSARKTTSMQNFGVVLNPSINKM